MSPVTFGNELNLEDAADEVDPVTSIPASTARLVMIGFGSIGRGTLPLIERHIDLTARPFTVIEPGRVCPYPAGEHGIRICRWP
jgi:homospermidine synthase